MYYIQYAEFLETRKLYQKAQEVYQIGLARNAQPFETLQNHFANFNIRLMASFPTGNH